MYLHIHVQRRRGGPILRRVQRVVIRAFGWALAASFIARRNVNCAKTPLAVFLVVAGIVDDHFMPFFECSLGQVVELVVFLHICIAKKGFRLFPKKKNDDNCFDNNVQFQPFFLQIHAYLCNQRIYHSTE